MATVISPNWGIVNLSEGQGSAEITVNAFVNAVLDMATNFRVKSATTTAEPTGGSVANGDCYILPASGITGTNWDPLANDANAKKIAFYYNGWTFYPVPIRDGFTAWVDDVHGRIYYDVTLAEWSHFQRKKHSDAIVALGTTQATAYVITSEINWVATVTPTNLGVKLPSARSGLQVLVVNTDSADTLSVWPFSGDKINALATDAAFTMAFGTSKWFYCFDAAQWRTL